jgi:hypothetical protein
VSSAFNHAIGVIGAPGFRFYLEVHREPRGFGPNPEEFIWRPGCSAHNCEEKPVFATRYLYVTGRAGRVTDRVQYCCRAHGEAFAKKHGLQMPELSPDPGRVPGGCQLPSGPWPK